MVQKDKDLCQIMDVACPYDKRFYSKELDKIELRELRNISNMNVKVIPLALGALRTTPIKLRNWLKEIDIETQITEVQKTVLLHTA